MLVSHRLEFFPVRSGDSFESRRVSRNISLARRSYRPAPPG